MAWPKDDHMNHMNYMMTLYNSETKKDNKGGSFLEWHKHKSICVSIDPCRKKYIATTWADPSIRMGQKAECVYDGKKTMFLIDSVDAVPNSFLYKLTLNPQTLYAHL
jgi:hypothetical protein